MPHINMVFQNSCCSLVEGALTGPGDTLVGNTDLTDLFPPWFWFSLSEAWNMAAQQKVWLIRSSCGDSFKRSQSSSKMWFKLTFVGVSFSHLFHQPWRISRCLREKNDMSQANNLQWVKGASEVFFDIGMFLNGGGRGRSNSYNTGHTLS